MSVAIPVAVPITVPVPIAITVSVPIPVAVPVIIISDEKVAAGSGEAEKGDHENQE